MVTQDQIRELKARVETLHRCLNIDSRRAEVADKEKRSQEASFWDDPKMAEAFLKDLNAVKAWVSAYDATVSALDDVEGVEEQRDSVGGERRVERARFERHMP